MKTLFQILQMSFHQLLNFQQNKFTEFSVNNEA